MPMEPRRAELRELRGQQERMLQELRELRADGKKAEAAEVKEQIARLEREIAQRERQPGPGVRPRGERPERPLPEGNEPERRQQHLREAVENLHAAGLPDIAEKVAQAGQDRLREEMRPQPGLPPEAVEQLHAQINELRERVTQLQAQVEKLSRGRN
jgi:DNA repair exonuclease SbcCD ATPase subunit